MKKGIKITFITLWGIILLIILLTLYFFVASPIYDKIVFNKAIDIGDVSYCNKIKSYFFTPGSEGTCISLVAQKNNDASICEKSNELQKNDCYAVYAYYKKDESLCVEPQCSKTLFNYCKKNGCKTIEDYK